MPPSPICPSPSVGSLPLERCSPFPCNQSRGYLGAKKCSDTATADGTYRKFSAIALSIWGSVSLLTKRRRLIWAVVDSLDGLEYGLIRL